MLLLVATHRQKRQILKNKRAKEGDAQAKEEDSQEQACKRGVALAWPRS
jgi:hypothetical protein